MNSRGVLECNTNDPNEHVTVVTSASELEPNSLSVERWIQHQHRSVAPSSRRSYLLVNLISCLAPSRDSSKADSQVSRLCRKIRQCWDIVFKNPWDPNVVLNVRKLRHIRVGLFSLFLFISKQRRRFLRIWFKLNRRRFLPEFFFQFYFLLLTIFGAIVLQKRNPQIPRIKLYLFFSSHSVLTFFSR